MGQTDLPKANALGLLRAVRPIGYKQSYLLGVMFDFRRDCEEVPGSQDGRDLQPGFRPTSARRLALPDA